MLIDGEVSEAELIFKAVSLSGNCYSCTLEEYEDMSPFLKD